jgi:hypothetical protein
MCNNIIDRRRNEAIGVGAVDNQQAARSEIVHVSSR